MLSGESILVNRGTEELCIHLRDVGLMEFFFIEYSSYICAKYTNHENQTITIVVICRRVTYRPSR